MELEDFLDLSNSELQILIPKLGHWNKLCRSREDFLAQKDNKGPINRQIPEQGVEHFLRDAGLDSAAYIASFEGNSNANLYGKTLR